ncbi:EcsC family protein [Cellulomonas sp. IC4_254]|uniref:EcsC family protein n=1 Tax=Cellulomonas sp. IC4_254 TaxID=2714040 RepID=UPI00141DB3F2|nr:EcsC family protein [Cellulomonas sp. IC4_254]NHT17953.1 EcsC family protein [Cellulomonas sp. IC4_254]
MSDYERRAYKRLTEPPVGARSFVPEPVREAAAKVGKSVRRGAQQVPGHLAVEEAYAKAAKGLIDVTAGSGVHSVSLRGAIQRHQKNGRKVTRAEDFLALDLRECDEALPNRKRAHEVVALAEGAAASLAITGTVVSTTVTGGATAAVVLGAVAVDSVVVMAGLGRIVGEVAVSYGFDPNLPEEEIFALQVMSLGMAVSGGAKTTALASLSRLTQDMMRRATWTQLNQHVLVGVINRAFASMGVRLTQKKLAQVVPVAGVLVSSGVNVQLVRQVHRAAEQAYRLRFLTVKYGLDDPGTAVTTWSGPDAKPEEDVVRMDELLKAAQGEVESELNADL